MQVISESLGDAVIDFRKKYGVDLPTELGAAVNLHYSDAITYTIALHPNVEQLCFYTKLCALPAELREVSAMILLQSNMFGLELPSAWLGLDHDSDQIMLCSGMPLRYASFDNIDAMLLSYQALAPLLSEVMSQTLTTMLEDLGDPPDERDCQAVIMP